ncbi:tRNA uracil 4-sulfurtransferase ThiI [Oceanispirochaeta sp.]|jgi:thiamine biosynthesis protein ThiI|uniref:tRNA uracil 4-sulfurtransferase ThiI n=1 Tax=Oceanispirochaeta sp. TaxID=2035350 RepID=UPI00261FCAA2|nr:tRNA uracil 4-sulfurtransferase ThiI [Oceanispirochaeta sp.]MDA3957505.1 tRNA 4-thiouridine(8) synthase ThiI [Oceanispirochaeta sp.]
MTDLYLIKIGEITLKKGNRALFERQLRNNIKKMLRPHPTRVTNRSGRFYLECEDLEEEYVSACLSKVFGIVGYTRSYSCAKELDALEEKALLVARQNIDAGVGMKFKIETRRIDKSLPLDNYGYSAEIGGRVFEKIPGLTVDVKNPDWIIHIELREKGYVYGYTHKGPGGLPVHTGGKGMLLLSGGIDSPVAGYLMSKRGMSLDAVYFHTPPYTSPESLEKVKDLARIIAPWTGGLTLYTVPFTDVQVQINRSVRPETTTLHSRAAMMKIAQSMAHKRKDLALITGEALSQVASQTLESLAYTNSQVDLPVFRPLIGMDKEETILISRKIKAFETSTQPYDDCCSLFSPEHPEVKPDLKKTREDWDGIEDIGKLMAQAEAQAEKCYFPAEVEKD